MEGTKTHWQMRQELVEKAAADDSFRSQLVNDPKAAIKDALGIDLPDSISIEVHEESATAAHLVLPPSPGLTEAELEGIAAGHRYDPIYGTEMGEHTHGRLNRISGMPT